MLNNCTKQPFHSFYRILLHCCTIGKTATIITISLCVYFRLISIFVSLSAIHSFSLYTSCYRILYQKNLIESVIVLLSWAVSWGLRLNFLHLISHLKFSLTSKCQNWCLNYVLHLLCNALVITEMISWSCFQVLFSAFEKREVLAAEGLAWNCATTICENVIKMNITH